MEEVELCFRITKDDANRIRERLKESFIGKGTEKDTYFFPLDRDFLMTKDGKENIRVRESPEKNELTYKNVIYNDWTYSHSEEISTTVSDAEKTIKLLEAIGFRIHLTVEKERETFDTGKFKITIDNVKDLGLFAEIEHKGENEKEILLKECKEMAGSLGLKDIEKKGYLRLLEECNSNKHVD